VFKWTRDLRWQRVEVPLLGAETPGAEDAIRLLRDPSRVGEVAPHPKTKMICGECRAPFVRDYTRTAAAADEDGSNLLSFSVEAVDELAAFAARGAAGDGGWLAPAGISTVLGVEESAPIRSTHGQISEI
jgi:hypothetical protein